ncbi:glutamate--tRNA ligase [Methanobrevibacter filiformis]|uniref:Glutamate--tRNA ligase n=1 Tax=Methanobrevibacter filiformis TaxID=55758 RepID=A0A166E8J8_9EURY|nr:glutamate--tRNA ligase [Methanobrevibacter filiformis]KZX16391.1 glutamine--tRNA ligase [Methanobrevibacter filiformis]
MSDLEKIVYKHGLINAVKHKGQANLGAVIGSIMSSEAELRKNAKEVSALAGRIVAEINGMSHAEQEDEIVKRGIEVVEGKKQEKEKGLVGLPGETGNVVMRFAPNPSGPLHIGHARAAVPNGEYVKRYDGKLILRIEDTDPKRIYPPAYDMVKEDLKWLGIVPDEVYLQSDRFPIYYEYAEKLIQINGAYMCTCKGEEFKHLKDESIPCPCRSNSVEENLKLWNDFNQMDAGEAVLRVKTDIKHKNPAIRDWVAMRIVEEPHPRLGDKYRIYPMMNFSVAIDDHLMNMTHVLRGKDHLANSEKQKYLYGHFGWDVPEFIHYGRLKMEDISLSTSRALAGIGEGEYSGWDDPRLGTLRAIAKRGIQSKVIHDLMIEIGIKMSDSAISWKKIYGLNRNILEEKANRYFFVENPKKIEINNIADLFDNSEYNDSLIIKRPLHPDFLDRGDRTLIFTGGVYLSEKDVQNGFIRLMDAVNINIVEGIAQFDSKSFEKARENKARIIQWVSSVDYVKADVVLDDNSIVSGYCEADCKQLKVGDIVQFERFGFGRLDKIEDDKLIFYFAHK